MSRKRKIGRPHRATEFGVHLSPSQWVLIVFPRGLTVTQAFEVTPRFLAIRSLADLNREIAWAERRFRQEVRTQFVRAAA